LKRRIVAIVTALLYIFQWNVFANKISDNITVSLSGILTVEGILSTPNSGELVNLLISRRGSENTLNNIILLKQTQTDETGKYIFNVNLDEAIEKGGTFDIKTSAQTENADTTDFEYYSIEELADVTDKFLAAKEIYEKDTVIAKIAEILKANEQILSFSNKYIKSLIDGSECTQMATILYSEDITSNIITVLNKISAVITIQNTTLQSIVKTQMTTFDTDLNMSSIAEYYNLSTNEKEELFKLMAGSTATYYSMSEFYKDIRDNIILAKLCLAGGISGILNILKTYSEKFDLTTYSLKTNDQTLMLKNVAAALENGDISSIEDVQKVLDTIVMIKKEFSGGSSGGRSSSFMPTETDAPAVTYDDGDVVKTDMAAFEDLEGYDWAKESIEKLVKLGILSGYANTVFAPSKNVTRAEFCKMLSMTLGCGKSDKTSGFEDIKSTDWFFEYVNAMRNLGVVSGVDEYNFAPDNYITREDLAVMVYRAISASGYKINTSENEHSFTDSADISDYAIEAVKCLNAAGLINGQDDGKFAPDNLSTRAEAAKIISNMYDFMDGGTK